MELVEKYREHAADWRAQAEGERDLRKRAECLCIADVWEKLAGNRLRKLKSGAS